MNLKDVVSLLYLVATCMEEMMKGRTATDNAPTKSQ